MSVGAGEPAAEGLLGASAAHLGQEAEAAESRGLALQLVGKRHSPFQLSVLPQLHDGVSSTLADRRTR